MLQLKVWHFYERLFFPKYAIHATNAEVVFYGVIFARLGYNTFAVTLNALATDLSFLAIN